MEKQFNKVKYYTWMDYNQINFWVVTGGILQLFIRKKI
jgi:hypothetical protein